MKYCSIYLFLLLKHNLTGNCYALLCNLITNYSNYIPKLHLALVFQIKKSIQKSKFLLVQIVINPNDL